MKKISVSKCIAVLTVVFLILFTMNREIIAVRVNLSGDIPANTEALLPSWVEVKSLEGAQWKITLESCKVSPSQPVGKVKFSQLVKPIALAILMIGGIVLVFTSIGGLKEEKSQESSIIKLLLGAGAFRWGFSTVLESSYPVEYTAKISCRFQDLFTNQTFEETTQEKSVVTVMAFPPPKEESLRNIFLRRAFPQIITSFFSKKDDQYPQMLLSKPFDKETFQTTEEVVKTNIVIRDDVELKALRLFSGQELVKNFFYEDQSEVKQFVEIPLRIGDNSITIEVCDWVGKKVTKEIKITKVKTKG